AAPLAIRRGENVARDGTCHVKFRSCRGLERSLISVADRRVRHREQVPSLPRLSRGQFASQFQSP
ncbi:hypothetical protein ABTI80_19295, partial [Acinetobacter baumannii]